MFKMVSGIYIFIFSYYSFLLRNHIDTFTATILRHIESHVCYDDLPQRCRHEGSFLPSAITTGDIRNLRNSKVSTIFRTQLYAGSKIWDYEYVLYIYKKNINLHFIWRELFLIQVVSYNIGSFLKLVSSNFGF